LDDVADGLYTEQLMRLPGGFLCYRNDARSSAVSAPPEAKLGYVTFGSFNTLAKVTAKVIDAWSEILKSVPDSRLMLKAESLENEKTKAALLELFGERKIAPERLDLLGLLPKADHFRLYSQLDIALDTFPYNGTTTTCEALWMGVPVITLSGSRHAGRVGASILDQVGRTDFVAHDRASYLSLAQSLAGDFQLRSRLRASLRERMQGSTLMNQSAFAEEMEDAYRRMWATWCNENH
jgi:predicted O-linked N-acetylglucosamine transferase (SPINDLY family)